LGTLKRKGLKGREIKKVSKLLLRRMDPNLVTKMPKMFKPGKGIERKGLIWKTPNLD